MHRIFRGAVMATALLAIGAPALAEPITLEHEHMRSNQRTATKPAKRPTKPANEHSSDEIRFMLFKTTLLLYIYQ